jgi:hypothetical protein
MLLSAIVALAACAHAPVVLWSDATRTRPEFVETAAIDALPAPLRAEVERDLAQSLRQRDEFAASARANGLAPPQCAPGMVGDTLQPVDAVTALRHQPLIARGIITGLRNGWDVPRKSVASVALVRIDEVWKGSGVAPNGIVAVAFPFGTFDRGGNTWCAVMKGSERIAVSRQLLVFGRLVDGSTSWIAGGGWAVEDGRLFTPQASSLSLQSVHSALQ